MEKGGGGEGCAFSLSEERFLRLGVFLDNEEEVYPLIREERVRENGRVRLMCIQWGGWGGGGEPIRRTIYTQHSERAGSFPLRPA